MQSKLTRWNATAVATMPAPATLAQWQLLMRAGVELAGRGRLPDANRLYAQALGVARALLLRSIAAVEGDGDGDGEAEDSLAAERLHDDRVAAFVVTRLNLADLCAAMGERHAAVAHRCIAHRTLMTLLRSDQVAPALQQAALRHSRQTQVALMDHVAAHGPHPDIEAALRAAPQPAATVH